MYYFKSYSISSIVGYFSFWLSHNIPSSFLILYCVIHLVADGCGYVCMHIHIIVCLGGASSDNPYTHPLGTDPSNDGNIPISM